MIKLHIRRVLFFAIVMALIAVGATFLLPPSFEGRAVLMVGEDIGMGHVSQSALRDDVQSIVDAGFGASPTSDGDVLRSPDLFMVALENVAKRENLTSLIDQGPALVKRFDVVQAEGSRTAEIVTQAGSPELAAELANEVAYVYNSRKVAIANGNLNQAATYLKTQLASAKQALYQDEAKYSEAMARTRVNDPLVATSSAAQYRNDLQHQVDLARSSYLGAVAEVDKLERAYADRPSVVDDNAVDSYDPQLKALEDQVTLYQHNLVDDQKVYDEGSPIIREDREALNRAQGLVQNFKGTGWQRVSKEKHIDQVKQTLAADLAEKRANRDSLSKQYASMLAAQKQNVVVEAKLPASEQEVGRLKRELDVAELNYRSLKSELDDVQFRIQAGAQASPILFPAVPQSRKVSPDPIKFGTIGTVAGICLGLLYSFGVEAFKMPVHSSLQLAEALGLGVAASVPGLSSRRATVVLRNLPEPNFNPAESFRYLTFAMVARGIKSSHAILVTGVGTDSEISASAGEFALSLSNAGVRTLLIDADFIKSRISRSFGLVDNSGVSDILDKSLLPNVHGEFLGVVTKHENLSVLPCGSKKNRAIGTYPLSELDAFLHQVKEQYSVVVIAVAPLALASDASALANYVDDVYLIVSATDSNLRSVASACDVLQRSGAKNLEVVLVNSSPKDEPFSAATSEQALV